MKKVLNPGFSLVLPLIFINIGMFMLQLALGEGFTLSLLLKRGDLFTMPWTLVTSMFLHGGASHLFFNMYALLIFGPILEQRIGQIRFITLYFATGIFAAIISQFIYTSALGASGAIMGIIGMVIMLMPNLRVLFFFIIPMPLWVAGIVMAALDIFGVFGFGIAGIANLAHLAGLGAGLLAGAALRNEKQKFDRKFSSKSELDDQDIEEYLKSGRI